MTIVGIDGQHVFKHRSRADRGTRHDLSERLSLLLSHRLHPALHAVRRDPRQVFGRAHHLEDVHDPPGR